MDGQWDRVRDDGDWDTTYRWVRINGVTGTSKAVITWRPAAGTAAGTYRILHHGDWKSLFDKVTAFTGVTKPFTVR